METCDEFSFSEEFFNALIVFPGLGSYLFLISKSLKPLTLKSGTCNEIKLLLCTADEGREKWKIPLSASYDESLSEVFVVMDVNQWG